MYTGGGLAKNFARYFPFRNFLFFSGNAPGMYYNYNYSVKFIRTNLQQLFSCFWWRIKMVVYLWHHGSFCHYCCLQMLPTIIIIQLHWVIECFSFAKWREWDNKVEGEPMWVSSLKTAAASSAQAFDWMCNGRGQRARMGGQSTYIICHRAW